MEAMVKPLVLAIALALVAGCGGGGGGGAPQTAQGGDNPPSGGGAPVPPPVPDATSLVSSVPAATYSGAYADEKLAVFNRLNEDRSKCGFGKLAQNTLLDKAAQAHADYLKESKQVIHDESPSEPGFTGKTPTARVEGVGYPYRSVGEVLISKLYGSFFVSGGYSALEEPALNGLRNLYASVYHLAGAMGSNINAGIGVANVSYSATAFGKILVIDSAIPTSAGYLGQQIDQTAVVTYPCEGTSGVYPLFQSEIPDPFPGVNLDLNPYGQPVYVMSREGTTLVLLSGSISQRGGLPVPTVTLTRSNDPVRRLQTNQIFLVPTVKLKDESTYDVELSGTNSGAVSATNPTGAFTQRFTFTTGTRFKG